MSTISKQTLVDAVNGIIKPMARKGLLHTLSHRIVRDKVEKKLGLEEGIVSKPEYKRIIKDATETAMNEEPTDDERDAEQQEPGLKSNSKGDSLFSSPMSSSSKRKRSSSLTFETAVSPPERVSKVKRVKDKASEDESSEEEPAPRKRLSKGKRDSAAKSSKTKSKPNHSDEVVSSKAKSKLAEASKSKSKSNMQFKTPEHVPTSDMDDDELEGSASVQSTKPSGAASKPKRLKAVPSDEDEDSGNDTEKHTSSKKRGPPTNEGDDSDTGLSDLVDEPPKRKKPKAAPKAKATKSRVSSSKAALSKNEDTIKRLKSLVLACGVRKVWSKLFKDMDERQQISKLKEMLAELGMTGRYSMEKAKEIKVKREFEKELEDVQEFAKSMQARGARGGSKTQSHEPEEESEEEGVKPRRRTGNARNSIAAFLQEQSDSD